MRFIPIFYVGTITENKEKIINNRAGKLVEERLRKEIEQAEEKLKMILWVVEVEEEVEQQEEEEEEEEEE